MTDGDHSGDNARREAVLLAIEAFHAARAKLASLISVEAQLAWFFIDPLKVASDPSDGEQRAAYLMARAGICALFLRDPGSLAPKALEFLFFDLSACVALGSLPPPPVPQPAK